MNHAMSEKIDRLMGQGSPLKGEGFGKIGGLREAIANEMAKGHFNKLTLGNIASRILALLPSAPAPLVWTKVSDALPSPSLDVLVCRYDGKVEIRYYVSPKTVDGVSYCWGWYPGGAPLENMKYWANVPEGPIIKHKYGGQCECKQCEPIVGGEAK